MYGIILVLVLVATGGLVAFWGDKVGRRIGKKRLTLFGLRPRYTSIVITIITGIVISTATLTILAVVSQDVRTALFGMKQLQESLATSESHLASVSADLARKTSQVQTLSDAITKKTEEYQHLNSKLLSVQKERDRVSGELAVVSDHYAKIKAEYQSMQHAYEKTKHDYTRARGELAKTSSELASAQSKVESLRSQLAPLEKQVESLEKERYNLLATKKRLETEINLLDKERDQLKTGLESMVFGKVVYRADEIVFSTVIAGGGSTEAVQTELSSFLAQANKVAVSRGARIEGKQGIAIKLLEGNFDTASNIIAQLSDDVVVRLISMTNVVEGEPVLTYFQILPKTKIWSEGETIASCQLDGRGSLEQIQLGIMELLYTVNNLAISRGMVADAEGKVGDLSLGEFRKTVTSIRAIDGLVTVEAKAAQDVWTTVLPLSLKLKISR